MAQLDPTGSRLLLFARLGGSGSDFGTALAIGIDGGIYVAGYTDSRDLPTLNAFQPVSGGGACGASNLPCFDAFIARMNLNGPAWDYVTYLGGSGDDFANGVAVDALGAAAVVGTTTSQDFPRLQALQESSQGGETEAFLAKIGPSGEVLQFATYLGGSAGDALSAVALGPSDEIFVVGTSNSLDLPVTDSLQPASGGGTCGALASTTPCSDAFVARLAADGQSLIYLTYLGGSGGDEGRALAVDGDGSAVVVGMTTSRDFPVTPRGDPDDWGRESDRRFRLKTRSLGCVIHLFHLSGRRRRRHSRGCGHRPIWARRGCWHNLRRRLSPRRVVR